MREEDRWTEVCCPECSSEGLVWDFSTMPLFLFFYIPHPPFSFLKTYFSLPPSFLALYSFLCYPISSSFLYHSFLCYSIPSSFLYLASPSSLVHSSLFSLFYHFFSNQLSFPSSSSLLSSIHFENQFSTSISPSVIAFGQDLSPSLPFPGSNTPSVNSIDRDIENTLSENGNKVNKKSIV